MTDLRWSPDGLPGRFNPVRVALEDGSELFAADHSANGSDWYVFCQLFSGKRVKVPVRSVEAIVSLDVERRETSGEGGKKRLTNDSEREAIYEAARELTSEPVGDRSRSGVEVNTGP